MPSLSPESLRIIEELATPDAASPSERPVETLREELEALARARSDRPRVGAVEDRLIDGGNGPITVRLYHPEGRRGDGLALYLHGGGWVRGSLETHDGLCRALCASSELTIASVDYRLAPEHPYPAAVDDCEAALRWAEGLAEERSPAHPLVSLMGDSAGANLAAVVARRRAGRSRAALASQVLICPVVDYEHESASFADFGVGHMLETTMMRRYWELYCPQVGLRTAPELSPAREQDLSGAPPTLVVTAACDPLRDQGEAYAQRLVPAGVPTTAIRVAGVAHPFVLLSRDLEPARATLSYTGGWLAAAHANHRASQGLRG